MHSACGFGIVYRVQCFGAQHRQGYKTIDTYVCGYGNCTPSGNLYAADQSLAAKLAGVLIDLKYKLI